MAMFPLKVRFKSEDLAYTRFHTFPPHDLNIVEGHSRKRFREAHLMLLHLKEEQDLSEFLELCSNDPDIVEVTEITIEEFKRSPSNSV